MSFSGSQHKEELKQALNSARTESSHFDMMPAVDFLNYEPNFLFKEFSEE